MKLEITQPPTEGRPPTCARCKVPDSDHSAPEAILCAANLIASAIRVAAATKDTAAR